MVYKGYVNFTPIYISIFTVNTDNHWDLEKQVPYFHKLDIRITFNLLYLNNRMYILYTVFSIGFKG